MRFSFLPGRKNKQEVAPVADAVSEGAVQPTPVPTEGGGDTHEARQSDFEAQMHAIKDRIPTMASIATPDEFSEVQHYIRWAQKDLDGNPASIVDARSGSTVNQLKASAQHASTEREHVGKRMYAVADLFDSVQVFVYLNGKEIETWTYTQPKEIEGTV
ncbi:MAG: hypothetical protein KBE09_01520 [Candidatus Pacebacteria bacterium]|nr:hypothetical protein [Candidatus Paceibacterota bacterium]